MSADLYVYSGLGYIFNINDEDFRGKLIETAPQTFENNVSDASNIWDMEVFFWETSTDNAEFSRTYPGLGVRVLDVPQGNIKEVVVVLLDSVELLYSKDERVDAGAVAMDLVYSAGKYDLTAFGKFSGDFNVNEEPHTLVWHKWR